MDAVTEMTNLAVDLIDVRKTYGKTVAALKGVNVQVRRGEIFGLLGPNGAGKTTLVKIMMTAVRATRAFGTILGRPIGHRGKLARIGYLPENQRFPSYLTVTQLLDYYAALAQVPRARRKENAARLVDRMWLGQWRNTRIDECSKGTLQRLAVAQALMNDPEMVVLDEPTDGLDPMGRRDVRELLVELKGQGKTIFLNSHLLSELEMVCDRVAILVDGLVARQGTLSELTEHTVEYRIKLAGEAESCRAELEKLGGALAGRLVTVSGHDPEKVNAAIDLLRSRGILLEAVEPHRFTLEDILVEVVGTTYKTPASIPSARAATPKP